MIALDRDENGIAHIVGLSGGKDSTCLAIWLHENEPRPYNYAITPTQDELPEMEAHWQSLEIRLGKPLIRIPAPSLAEVIESQKMLPNFRARFCTRMIKLKPYGDWIRQALPAVSYIGLRDDEEDREGAQRGGDYVPANLEGLTQRYPLREIGFTLEDVQQFLMERQIRIPDRTDCARCPYQKLGEWFNLYQAHPTIYADAEAMETQYGHTFRSAKRDSWPASLAELRERFEQGIIPERSLKMMETRKGMCRVCTL